MQIEINLKLRNWARSSAEDALLALFALYCEFGSSFFCCCCYLFCCVFKHAVTFCRNVCEGIQAPEINITLCVCFFFLFHNTCLLLPRCPDGYFGPRCLQTEPLRVYMPNPFKSMFKWYEQLTTETQLSLDYLCGLLLPSSSPPLPNPHQISSSFSSSSSFSGQHALSCALHHAHDGVIQREHSASAVCRCSVVLILCLSSSLPLSLPPLLPPPSLLSHFFLLTLSFSLHPLPLYFLPFSHSFTTLLLFLLLSFFGFVSFHQVSKWLYWWSLSNLRYGQFLPYVNFLFCHCQSVLVSRVHAGCRDRINFLLLPNSFVCVCSGDSFTSWHRLVESVTVFGLHVILCALWLSAVRCMRILRIRVRSEADSSESACEFALCKLICTSQVACNDTV